MTDTPEQARIRAALEAWNDDYYRTEYRRTELADACNPEAMTALLAHMDAQAAEIERLQADAARLQNALETFVEIAIETHECWDADCDAKVGELLMALVESNRGYDKRVDEIHAAMKEQP